MVADGTYTGDGNKNLDFNGKAITVQSENGPENCIIDCEGDGRGFYFHSAEEFDSVVSGFTITNGYFPSMSCTGICCNTSSPTIENCIISGNSTNWNGGGLCCTNSYATIKNCIIRNNNASYHGGGIYLAGPGGRIVRDCTISENTVGAGSGGAG